MTHYLELALKKLNDLKGQKKYVENVLNQGNLDEWEAKEYSQLLENYMFEINIQKQHIESAF